MGWQTQLHQCCSRPACTPERTESTPGSMASSYPADWTESMQDSKDWQKKKRERNKVSPTAKHPRQKNHITPPRAQNPAKQQQQNNTIVPHRQRKISPLKKLTNSCLAGWSGCTPDSSGCTPDLSGSNFPGDSWDCRPDSWGCRPGSWGCRPDSWDCRPGSSENNCQPGSTASMPGSTASTPGSKAKHSKDWPTQPSRSIPGRHSNLQGCVRSRTRPDSR